MQPEVYTVLISMVSLVVVVGFLLYRDRLRPLSLESVISTVEEATPLAETLKEVATIGVQAAEQLMNTGKLPRDQRFNYAVNYVKSWNPALARLENEKIFGAIESAVLVVNALSAQLQAAKE